MTQSSRAITWLATTLYPNQITQNIAEPFSFLGPDFEDIPTGGFEGWEIIDTSRWRLHLMPGVKFHNGEIWDADAAKWNIDTLGSNVEYQSYSNVRASHAEEVDDLTVDFVCDENPCSALSRFAQFHLFIAPAHYQNTTQEDRDAKGQTIGWGPYQWKEWKRGQFFKLERYEDYVEPHPQRFIYQRGSIKEVTYVWREEELVRMAMIQAGEADLAWAVSGDLGDDLNVGTVASGWIAPITDHYPFGRQHPT